MPRKNKILLRTGSTTPSAADFVTSEPAWDSSAGKLYVKNAAGSMVEIGAGGSGGSAELVFSYATTANLPATGDDSLLYFVTDSGRMFRWVDSTTKYVEVGSLGGGGLFWTAVPATRTSSGAAGSVAYGSDGYLYVATADSTWRRVAISSWSEDPYSSSVVALLHMNGTNGSTSITDSSSLAKTITVGGGSAISTAQSKFGGSSLYCDGTGDYISIPSVTLSADFTVEFWLRWAAAVSKDYSAMLLGTNTNTQFFLTTKQDRTGLRFGLTGVAEYATGSFSWSANTWYHITLTRASNAIKLYVDGSDVTSGSPTTSQSFYGDLRVGGDGGTTYDSNVYIDDLRITAGVARSVAVPTAAYPDP